MPNKKEGKPLGNIYDRIFRENAKHLFIPLIEKVMGIEIVSYKALPVKFPQTSEREVDFLYEIKQANDVKQILHLEFQSANDPIMLERMQEYHSKIYKTYKLPIKPLVINLSRKAFTAQTQLKPNEIFTGYDVINLFELSTEELLSNQIPEVVILALLSNFPENEIEAVLRLIVKKLKQIVNTEKDLRRYVTQLLLLSRLRNFGSITKEILDAMPIIYDVEKDTLYQRGIEKGEKRGIEKGEKRGIEKGEKRGIEKGVVVCYEIGLSAEEIADKFDIDISKVLQIIEQRSNK